MIIVPMVADSPDAIEILRQYLQKNRLLRPILEAIDNDNPASGHPVHSFGCIDPMLAPSQEENTNPNEARFVSHSDVSLAYTPAVINWLSSTML